MEQAYVNLKVERQIGRITFYHPSANAMPGYLLSRLAQTITKAGQDDNIKLIILQSEGRTFCAGASFDELLALKTHEQAVTFFLGFAKVINAMREAPKFILAKVQGKAVGGGVGLIAAADYAMASEKAAVKLSELSIGIGPYVIGPAVKRKIGIAAFSELSIDATTWYTAFWAREKSLYAKVLPSLNQLDDAIDLLADKLCKYDSLATARLKQDLWEGTENWPVLLAEKAEVSARLVMQEYTKDFLSKFKNT